MMTTVHTRSIRESLPDAYVLKGAAKTNADATYQRNSCGSAVARYAVATNTKSHTGLSGPPVSAVATIRVTTGMAADGPSHKSVLSYECCDRTAVITKTVTTRAHAA